MDDAGEFSKTIHSPIISFFICVGLFANLMFLMSLKADKPNISNSEKIQVYKTCLAILALLSYIPIELWVMQLESVTSTTCRVKDLLQSIFLDTIPIGIFAVAIVRFRLTVFNGDSITHVTKRLRILIILTCSVVSMTIGLSKFFYGLASSGQAESSTPENITVTCYQIGPQTLRYFNITSSLLMYAIPSIIMTCLYIGIIYISIVSITKVQHLGGQREQVSVGNVSTSSPRDNGSNVHISDPETNSVYIQRFIGTLVVLFLITSFPISSIEIYLSTNHANANGSLYIALLYFKTAMCIFHAAGEGVFCIDKIRRARLFVDRYITRSFTTSQQFRGHSHEHGIYSIPVLRTKGKLSTLNEISTPPPSSRNKASKNIQENECHAVSNTSIGLSTSAYMDYYNDVFEETNAVQQSYTDGSRHAMVISSTTIPKDLEAAEHTKTTDLKSRVETSKTDCLTPRLQKKYRADSTFKHYSIPGMPSWKSCAAPNRRRSSCMSSVSSVLSASVFSEEFDYPQRISIETRRARTTSVRTPDFEEICNED